MFFKNKIKLVCHKFISNFVKEVIKRGLKVR